MALVDETESDLARYIFGDFGPFSSEKTFERRLIDWFHYRARLIATKPRIVTMSSDVQTCLPNYSAISHLAKALREGKDVSPWLSDRVRKRREDHRADLMFNSWQVSHFHLGAFFEKRDKIVRGSSLLFAYIDNKEAVLLKVADHRSWTDRTILEALLATRQPLMDQWWLRGVLPGRENWDEDQMRVLRSKGLTVPIAIGDKVFAPGLGTSSSSHATRLVLKTQRFLRALSNLREDIRLNRLVRETQSRVTWPLGVPVKLRVQLTTDGELQVYDANRNWGFFAEHAPY